MSESDSFHDPYDTHVATDVFCIHQTGENDVAMASLGLYLLFCYERDPHAQKSMMIQNHSMSLGKLKVNCLYT